MTVNHDVAGSSPARGAIQKPWKHSVFKAFFILSLVLLPQNQRFFLTYFFSKKYVSPFFLNFFASKCLSKFQMFFSYQKNIISTYEDASKLSLTYFFVFCDFFVSKIFSFEKLQKNDWHTFLSKKYVRNRSKEKHPVSRLFRLQGTLLIVCAFHFLHACFHVLG